MCSASGGGRTDRSHLTASTAAFAVGKALEGMARQPESTSNLRTNMLVGCAVAETTGIYSLVIALLLMFAFK